MLTKEIDPDWIKRARMNGFFQDDFIPYRYFHKIWHDTNGTTFGNWWSWFVNEKGKLQKFWEDEPEEINDTLVSWFGDSIEHIKQVVNGNEVKRYRENFLYDIPTKSIQAQLKLWEMLQEESPIVTDNLQLTLTYPPIEILKRELLERATNAVTAKNASKKTVSTNTKVKLKEWNGTLTELAGDALKDYQAKKFRNLKKACEEYSKKYLFNGKKIKTTSLYTMASDIQRGEREINKNKQK